MIEDLRINVMNHKWEFLKKRLGEYYSDLSDHQLLVASIVAHECAYMTEERCLEIGDLFLQAYEKKIKIYVR